MVVTFNQSYYHQLLEELKQLRDAEGIRMVAIDGRCASGKSTLGARLAEDLGVTLLHMDDFYLQKHQRTPERYQEPGGNVDRERVSELLASLKQGKDTEYHKFDHRTFGLGEKAIAVCTPLILVEGSYSHHSALAHFFDRRYFVTVDPQVQLARIAVRNPDKVNDFKEKWIPLEERYFQSLQVAEHADVVMDTTSGEGYEKGEQNMTENNGLTKEFVQSLPKLGFGLMRLPRVEGTTTDEIDIEQTSRMVDMFLDAGMNYFDTAFVYNGSEEAIAKALCDRKPRDSYYLATKLNAGMPGLTKETAEAELKTSLERTHAQYIDFYLLHALGKRNIDKYNDWDLWQFCRDMKEQGVIKHYGFSFHDTPELLDEILTAHPDVEFVQLQINYADMEAPTVQSRACYDVCVKHGKPVIVMEPVKGGALANPPAPVQEIMKAADPNASCASWAIRFVASMSNVMVVLSGMSNVAQMEDNLSYMKDFKPLDEAEIKVMNDVQEAMKKIPQIPCTSCRYCTPVCPMQIQIPNIFQAMNQNMIYGNLEGAKRSYGMATKENSKASECIKCGMCEEQCPQHLEIRDLLEKCAAALEA